MNKTVSRWLRRAWRWLTGMRTALVLLFLLAIAAVPGALLPQRSLNQTNVEEFIAANGRVAELYEKLGLFDVFKTPWFAAIYVLLMISLIGCIIPRSWDHWKAYRTPPRRAPKRLEKLPLHMEGDVEKPASEVLAQARGLLKRWHVTEFDAASDRAGAPSLSAERGYARELANLVFHIAIVALLVFMAAGRLGYYEGQVIKITNSDSPLAVPAQMDAQFCNTSPSNYNSFRAGPTFDGTGLNPYCFQVHNFVADYLDSGQADMFSADVSYASGEDITTDPATWKTYTLRVNHPLRIAGDRVYLQGHGYAPQFTITWPNGEKRTQMVQWLPSDPTYFLSSGAMRFDPPAGMYPDLYDRRQHQIALQGLFAPTAQWGGDNGELLSSSFPEMKDPAVAIDIYRGDAGLDTGTGQSLFQLDHSLIASGALQRLERVNLTKGQSITLDDGTIVTFDGATEFANFQIGHDSFQIGVLVSALVLLGALVLSLMIKRRRLFIRVRERNEGGRTVTHVELGGLARTDRAGWGPEFEQIARTLLGLADPDEVEEDTVIDGEIIGHSH